MQDIVFYAAANETLGMVRDYSNMNKSSAPVLTLGVAVCLRMRLFAGIKVPTPYPVASLNGITDWQWSMDADFDRSTTCKLVADAGGISVHTVTDTVNGETMNFTEFVIPISNMNTQELAAWLGNEGTKSGLTGELVGYDNEAHAVFVLQIEGFKVRNRIAGLGDPTAVDEGIVTRPLAEQMIRTAVSASAATKQDKLTSANAGVGIAITGGTQISVDLAGGERMAIVSGNTVAQLRYFDITNITGGTVTLEAGHAYRLNATTGTKTLYAEEMADDTFGLEGHIEIFVANAGNIQTGKLAGGTTEVILADALEPDAVNNCTVRFHDHKAIISVEDHVAGHIVTVSAGTAANSLYYWLTQPNTAGDAATQYVGFDATLNGTPVNFEGAANTAVKHVVGNGYTQTLLTGNVAPAAALTVSDLGLQNVTVTGGTLTLGDAYIPSGSTVAVSGGGLAVEKVTGNGGVIDLGGSAGYVANAPCFYGGVTITGGTATFGPAGMASGGATATISNCTISSNVVGNAKGGAFHTTAARLSISGSTIAENTGYGLSFYYAPGQINSCVFSNNTRGAAHIAGNTSSIVEFNDNTFDAGQNIVLSASAPLKLGNNTLKSVISGSSGFVTLTSGAILDLTGNTNAYPVAPGGGITFASGGATVLVGSGTASSSYMMDNVNLPAGAKLTNTATVDLGGTHVVRILKQPVKVSGCTFTSGVAYANTDNRYGGAFSLNQTTAVFSNCQFIGNNGNISDGRGGGIYAASGSGQEAILSVVNCVFTGNVAYQGNAIYTLVQTTIQDCVFNANQSLYIRDTTATFVGTNVLKSNVAGNGSIIFANGATIDLTDNSVATPIAPGGGITLDASPSSGVVIIGSAGSGTQTRTFAGGGTITGSAVTKIGAISGATVTLPSSSCQIEFVKSGETVVSSAFIQASETPYVLETQQGAGAVLVRAIED